VVSSGGSVEEKGNVDERNEILKVLGDVGKRGCLSGKVLEELSLEFGERFWRALRAVAERRVKKYVFEPSGRRLWVVVGRRQDYLIISDFYCSCEDFYLNVVVRRKTFMCYHLLAKRLAEALKVYETYMLSDEEFEPLVEEWKSLEREC